MHEEELKQANGAGITFPIVEVYITPGVAAPEIPGFRMITCQGRSFNGEEFERYEFVPDYCDLCEGGNGSRRGNAVRDERTVTYFGDRPL